MNVVNKKCEDCQLKLPSFGLPAEGTGRWRWCGGCAKGHAGAVDISHKKCEDCGLKQPHFGLPAEGKTRWCCGCAKAHKGAENIKDKMCEGCGLKQPNYGLPAEGKRRRWCAGCAPLEAAHAGGKTPQKKLMATDPPLIVSDLKLGLGSKYRLGIGNLYEAAPRAGLRVWGRCQTEKKTAPQKQKATKKKAAAKKQHATKKKAAPTKK